MHTCSSPYRWSRMSHVPMRTDRTFGTAVSHTDIGAHIYPNGHLGIIFRRGTHAEGACMRRVKCAGAGWGGSRRYRRRGCGAQEAGLDRRSIYMGVTQFVLPRERLERYPTFFIVNQTANLHSPQCYTEPQQHSEVPKALIHNILIAPIPPYINISELI